MASKDEKKPTIDSVRDDINKVQNQIIQLSEHQKKLLSDLRVVEQEFEYDIYRNMVGKFLVYTEYDDGVESFTDYTYVNSFDEDTKTVKGV
jgi:predicted transcriptional regulator